MLWESTDFCLRFLCLLCMRYFHNNKYMNFRFFIWWVSMSRTHNEDNLSRSCRILGNSHTKIIFFNKIKISSFDMHIEIQFIVYVMSLRKTKMEKIFLKIKYVSYHISIDGSIWLDDGVVVWFLINGKQCLRQYFIIQ